MRVKLVVAVAPPESVTPTVIVVLPLSFALGKINNERLGPFPSTEMPASDTNFVFEDRTLTIRLATGVSASPTVKVKGPAGRFTSVVWSPIRVIVGSVFLVEGCSPVGG